MNCKNCNTVLEDTAKFCYNCGAKMVYKRLSLKMLIGDFFNKVFGWDNSYFRTFRTFVTNPAEVAQAYIKGIRKKYISPITFLVIGLTFGTLVFNAFADKYVEYNTLITDVMENYQQGNDDEQNKGKTSGYPDSKQLEGKDKSSKNERVYQAKKQAKTTLKYFNLLAFLTMPVYTLMAFLVFGWKRYNYSEHLVVNAYLQGFSMISTTVFFVLGIFISPWLYIASILVTIFYYLFTYKKLFEISWLKIIWKLFKFILIVLLFMMAFVVLLIVLKSLGIIDL